MMNLTAAATASAKSWKKLADGLDALAEAFAPITEMDGQDFLADLLYNDPKIAAGRAYTKAAQATARSFPRD